MNFLLTLAVVILIFLNGATDASSAIAASVASGAMRMRRAAILSAVCNTAGGIIGGICFPGISRAVIRSADFGTHGEAGVLITLAATVLFTFIAWLLRLPTSESHALLASAAGASMVFGSDAFSLGLLLPAFLWMTLSAGAGFLAGILMSGIFPRSLPPRTLRLLQILCAAGASFLHGVQDLGKFTALLCAAGGEAHPLLLPTAAAVLGIGTLCGGRRITEAAGNSLAEMDSRTALATDLGSALSLFVLSFLNIPASTTHTRTASAAGGASISRGCRLHRAQLLRFAAAWALTFPLCTALAAALGRLLLLLIY